MIVDKKFISSIPIEKREIVFRKIYEFESKIREYKNYREMPKGFWIRKVEGTEIFKFRINNGDRILFRYEDNKENNDIAVNFLAYATHDKQIVSAKNKFKSTQLKEVDFGINMKQYVENSKEREEDSEIAIYEELSRISSVVIEDEYISLLIEEDDEDYLKFLSSEQYECLQIFNKPVFITGCAGSGKSIIGIRKIMMNMEKNVDSMYITYSGYLKSSSENKLHSMSGKKNKSVSFLTINELCCKIIGAKNIKAITFNDFSEWTKENQKINMNKMGVTCEEVWYEIVNTIKGTGTTEFMERDAYVYSSSNMGYDIEARKNIYYIAWEYKKWLAFNNYMDENDLAFKAIEALKDKKRKPLFIVVDEMQDMYNSQIKLLLELSDRKNLIFMWDNNQVARYNDFNIGRVKAELYENNLCEKKINKNFRNTMGIDNLSKKILEIGRDYSSNVIEYGDLAIFTEDRKPLILNCSKEEINKLLIEADNHCDMAIVVSDEEEKKKLKEELIPTGRVFTVDEIKGLDYKSIICVNVISNVNRYIDKYGVAGRNKVIAAQKINAAYTAVTRARRNLTLIEDTECNELCRIKDFLNTDSNIDYNKIGINSFVSDEAAWHEEAQRMENAEKYYQASEAYRKAGLMKKAEECKNKIVRRNREINNIGLDTTIRIEGENDLNSEVIKAAFSMVIEKYDVRFDNYMDVWIPCIKEGQFLKAGMHLYDEDNIIDSIAESWMKIIDCKGMDINKKKFTVHICLVKDGEVAELSEVLREDKDSIIIDINSKNEMNMHTLKTKTEEQRYFQDMQTALEKRTDYNKSVKMDIISKAYANYSSGNYRNALELYKEALKDKGIPDEIKSTIYSIMCSCKIQFKEYKDAIDFGKMALRFDKNNNDGYVNTAVAYLNLGRFEEAISYYEKAKYRYKWMNAIDDGIIIAQAGIEHRKNTGISRRTLTNIEFDNLNHKMEGYLMGGRIKEYETLIEYSYNHYNMPSNFRASHYENIAAYMKYINNSIGEQEYKMKAFNAML